MEHRIVFHPKAETELDQLYDDIATRASPAIAWNFVVGIRDDFLSVSTFPQCGTAGRDHASSADHRLATCRQHCFRSRCRTGLVLGIFFAGSNITAELLEGRL
ncbi:type II toxin-antitoxin system RelE/ParE family toxin [Mesorhizobium sp. L2C066B000]|uniref:type II toxin-antitoxin system RelE/ParE family toxin n=1 Tax=Mesorhizobium sp. L2C066B000 TaxID=1287105 RepID=UPI0003D054F7|nr:hypothetical protein X732_33670 [Mesorhizobium sp. L2C066B000]